eukprot:scaffold122086_cov32-Tisochrysis_lutea.AAC.3
MLRCRAQIPRAIVIALGPVLSGSGLWSSLGSKVALLCGNRLIVVDDTLFSSDALSLCAHC